MTTLTNYGTVAAYKAYWLARDPLGLGVTLDNEDTSILLAELLKASDYIDNKYRTLFPGLKVGFRAQIREWPRTSAFDNLGFIIPATTIPVELTNAVYEAAAREHTNPGSLTVDYKATETIKTAHIEGAVSVTFFGSPDLSDVQLTIPAVDRILAPILTGEGGSYSGLSGPAGRS